MNTILGILGTLGGIVCVIGIVGFLIVHPGSTMITLAAIALMMAIVWEREKKSYQRKAEKWREQQPPHSLVDPGEEELL